MRSTGLVLQASCLAMLMVLFGGPGQAKAASITLSATVRDFTPATNPDFERIIATDPGIVKSVLGADGTPDYDSSVSNPTITSVADFAEWYHTIPGVNIAIPISLTLTETFAGSGIYVYDNSAYFPIDGMGFGNYASTGHNFHFTTEIHTQFTYAAGQTFSFTGDDDVWVFINKKLAIDLGGVHPALSASVALDSLGLTAGSTYDLDIFHAERHTSASNFKITTSIALRPVDPVPEPVGLTLAGIGLVCLMGYNWRVRRSTAGSAG